MGDFRFGVGLRSIGSREEWLAKCRRAEAAGFDAITIPDHLGAPAPFPAIVSAAVVTERPRVGPLVLNVPFYNPALLARDIASTVEVTGGRLDLGLGAGHMKWEFDDAGLPWEPVARRTERLAEVIGELRRRLAGDMPPLLVAGNSDGVLRVAAEHADIVGFAGTRQARGLPPGTLDLDSAEQLDERVAFFREHAGGRAVEANMLIQHVEVTSDPGAVYARLKADVPHISLTAEQLHEAPQLLVGTPEEIVARVRGLRERYGFTYITVFEAFLETFAPLMGDI
ncbi:TIGR03621 family F420-dependent LLM class oxidoreductase [Amycolatopsis suaedae]|uniref:TIGR03621 family F420-dependent LLM class oxidoreductase n=1 Tax=Amycolatopsis suaedae TaxID=2510978 RepID=A0A4Q7J746_9PSEU|nr:TIGR03621 family F420-dependent LLM class oxidoreductase [Amycolatopsis suaedae]RZQ63480.1 TIGR03621 family F420-dependent LLM class oxidoreductase [Amycolatopsis suaedae]